MLVVPTRQNLLSPIPDVAGLRATDFQLHPPVSLPILSPLADGQTHDSVG